MKNMLQKIFQSLKEEFRLMSGIPVQGHVAVVRLMLKLILKRDRLSW